MIRIAKEQINTPGYWSNRAEGMFDLTVDVNRAEVMASRFKGGRYLDVGVFNSHMPGILSERFPTAEIVAVDHSPKVVQVGKERFPKVNYMVGDIYDLPFEDNYFDHVVLGEVIEHLSRPWEACRELIRVLKPNKHLIITTPYEETLTQNRVDPKEHMCHLLLKSPAKQPPYL